MTFLMALHACPVFLNADVPRPSLPTRMPEIQKLNIVSENSLDQSLVELFKKIEQAEFEQNIDKFKITMSQIHEYCANKEGDKYREIALWSALTLGINWAREGNFETALTIIENSINKFHKNPTILIRFLIVKMYRVRAALLIDLNQWNKCIETSDQLYKMALENDLEDPKDTIAASLFFKLIALEQSRTPKNLIIECKKIINANKSETHPKMLGVTCIALYQQGIAQVKINQLKDSLASFEAMLKMVKDVNDLELKQFIALAIFTKAGALELLGRNFEAKRTYQELVDTYKNIDDPSILELTEQASRWIKMHNKISR